MEHGEASGLRARGPFPLGFFLQPHPPSYEKPWIYGLKTTPCPLFISISDQGNDLEDGKWGSFDPSLSFLERTTVHIVDSSNGFLLCTTNIMEHRTYIICNPVTREYLILPEPQKKYGCIVLAFICKGDGNSLSEVRYEVVRAGGADPRKLITILEIEIFSSETGVWKGSSLIPPSPFDFVLGNIQALVLEDVIYWETARRLALLAYDRVNESLDIIDLPPRTLIDYSICARQSEGKLYYARSGTSCMEVWVLEQDRKKAEWSLKHKVNLTTMIQQNPNIGTTLETTMWIDVEHMHPWNSKQILIQLSRKPFLYDLETGKLTEISVDVSGAPLPTYFLYEWPCAALPP